MIRLRKTDKCLDLTGSNRWRAAVQEGELTELTAILDLSCNANAVVFKHSVPAFLLRNTILEYFSPGEQRGFIPPF